MLYIFILIMMTMAGAVGSYHLKMVSGSNSIAEVIKNKHIYLGGSIYLIGAVLNIYLLRFLDYSIVLPLTSLTYIWTMAISHKMLGEKITKRKIFGTVFIVCGAVIIGFS
jgi:drug/metabolite transporter (DMT)-like permease